MKDKWSIDPESIEGVIARPYFVSLPKDWQLHKHYNTEDLERRLEAFVGSSIFTAPYGAFSDILRRKR